LREITSDLDYEAEVKVRECVDTDVLIEVDRGREGLPNSSSSLS